jgi:acyl carrier protein
LFCQEKNSLLRVIIRLASLEFASGGMETGIHRDRRPSRVAERASSCWFLGEGAFILPQAGELPSVNLTVLRFQLGAIEDSSNRLVIPGGNMTSLEQAQERVAKIMGEHLQIDIKPENYEDDLHLDSMALLELIVGLEKEFGVAVDEEQLDTPEHFKSVASISKFVLAQLKP